MKATKNVKNAVWKNVFLASGQIGGKIFTHSKITLGQFVRQKSAFKVVFTKKKKKITN